MATMRFYWIDPENRIHRPAEEVDCRDDADAVAKAAAGVTEGPAGWGIEVWDHARLVAKLPPAFAPRTGTRGPATRPARHAQRTHRGAT